MAEQIPVRPLVLLAGEAEALKAAFQGLIDHIDARRIGGALSMRACPLRERVGRTPRTGRTVGTARIDSVDVMKNCGQEVVGNRRLFGEGGVYGACACRSTPTPRVSHFRQSAPDWVPEEQLVLNEHSSTLSPQGGRWLRMLAIRGLFATLPQAVGSPPRTRKPKVLLSRPGAAVGSTRREAALKAPVRRLIDLQAGLLPRRRIHSQAWLRLKRCFVCRS
jgi:hypothetical protein